MNQEPGRTLFLSIETEEGCSQGLLGKYAGHLLEKDNKIAAIDLFRKANKHTEVASLLTQLAKTSAAAKVCPLRVKKLYVLGALEVCFHAVFTFDCAPKGYQISTPARYVVDPF